MVGKLILHDLHYAFAAIGKGSQNDLLAGAFDAQSGLIHQQAGAGRAFKQECVPAPSAIGEGGEESEPVDVDRQPPLEGHRLALPDSLS